MIREPTMGEKISCARSTQTSDKVWNIGDKDNTNKSVVSYKTANVTSLQSAMDKTIKTIKTRLYQSNSKLIF